MEDCFVETPFHIQLDVVSSQFSSFEGKSNHSIDQKNVLMFLIFKNNFIYHYLNFYYRQFKIYFTAVVVA